MPVGILFGPAVFLIIGYFSPQEFDAFECICFCNKVVRNCWGRLIMALIMVPILLALGLVVGAIALGIFIVPAYLY